MELGVELAGFGVLNYSAKIALAALVVPQCQDKTLGEKPLETQVQLNRVGFEDNYWDQLCSQELPVLGEDTLVLGDKGSPQADQAEPADRPARAGKVPG
jgi:hypothetical protein